MDTLTPLVVHNKSDVQVTLGWNNHFVTIPPGQSRTATFDAVANFFGDPRAVDDMHSEVNDAGVRSWIPDRKSEVRRLQCKWGNNFGMDESKIFAPEVEVTTLEGERIWTVVEDPEGVHVNPKLIAIENQQDLETQINRMQKQLDTLLNLRESGIDTPPDNGEIPEDSAPAQKSRGRILAKGASDE